jgi:hypothetical protein
MTLVGTKAGISHQNVERRFLLGWRPGLGQGAVNSWRLYLGCGSAALSGKVSDIAASPV